MDIGSLHGPANMLRLDAVIEDTDAETVRVIYSVNQTAESVVPCEIQRVIAGCLEGFIAMSTEAPVDKVTVSWSSDGC